MALDVGLPLTATHRSMGAQQDQRFLRRCAVAWLGTDLSPALENAVDCETVI